MIRIAIVEDEPVASETLKNMIIKFMSENVVSAEFDIAEFSDAETFLGNFSEYEVIFLDIQMSGMSGMDAAREVRKRNEKVLIVFVTNMAQYAVESYEVEAYDFILKPLSYGNFFMKFRRILKKNCASVQRRFLHADYQIRITQSKNKGYCVRRILQSQSYFSYCWRRRCAYNGQYVERVGK